MKCWRSNSGKFRSGSWTRQRAPSSFESRAKAGSFSLRREPTKVWSRHLKRAIERMWCTQLPDYWPLRKCNQGDALVIDHILAKRDLFLKRYGKPVFRSSLTELGTADDCGSSSLSGVHNSLEMSALQRLRTGAQHEHSSRSVMELIRYQKAHR